MSVYASARPSDTVLGWYDATRRSLEPWVQAWAAAADDTLAPGQAVTGGTSAYPAPAWAAAAGWPAPYGWAAPSTASPWDWMRPAAAKHHRDDCGCGDRPCGCDDHDRGRVAHHRSRDHDDCCGDPCRACVADADLVVTARPGERRVVPVELRNTWHRERTITVGLSGFAADQCGPDPIWVVTGAVAPVGEVTIAPCSRTTLELLIEVGVPKQGKPATKAEASAATEGPVGHRATTYYADLSLAGCGRSQRIAVVVLPDRCGATVVTPSPCCC